MKKHSGGGAQREEPHWAYKQLRLCTRRAFAQVPASVAGCAKRTKRCALCSEAKLRWTSSQAEKLDNLSKLCYGSGPTLPPALPRSLACFPSLSLSLSRAFLWRSGCRGPFCRGGSTTPPFSLAPSLGCQACPLAPTVGRPSAHRFAIAGPF